MSSSTMKTQPAFAGYGHSENTGLVGEVRRVVANVATWMRQRAVYRNTIAELYMLSDRDLADIGIQRLDIPAVARKAAKAQRNVR